MRVSSAAVSLFCRHNRYTADCPICSKGTALDPERGARRRSGGTGPRRSRSERRPATAAFSGPHVSAGPYEDEQGIRYVVRLERVPGGVRLAEWAGSELRRRAPVLRASDMATLAAGAHEVLPAADAQALAGALGQERSTDGDAGVSRGRAGDFREELRVESIAHDRVRVGRWVQRPGAGWELRDAPPMLPAARYAEALGDAARKGVLAPPSGDETARPI
jgi:hypothetical protein